MTDLQFITSISNPFNFKSFRHRCGGNKPAFGFFALTSAKKVCIIRLLADDNAGCSEAKRSLKIYRRTDKSGYLKMQVP
jgi:hypothetical protein